MIERLMDALSKGDWSAARRFSTSLILMSPDELLGWKALGVVLHLQGDDCRALKLLQLGIRLRPDDTECLYNLGLAYQKMGRDYDARLALENAIRLRPDYAEARSNLAVSLNTFGEV